VSGKPCLARIVIRQACARAVGSIEPLDQRQHAVIRGGELTELHGFLEKRLRLETGVSQIQTAVVKEAFTKVW
jgi:hypothetical protein